MDAVHRGQHRRDDARAGERSQEPGREQRPAPSLADAGGDRIGLTGTHTHLFEALGGRIEAVASPPAEQLLGAVPDEQHTDNQAQQQTQDLHINPSHRPRMTDGKDTGPPACA